jgi:hypothetical protein
MGLDGRIWFNCGWRNGISLGSFSANQWYFLAGSIDTSFRIIFYKNETKIIDQKPTYQVAQTGGALE